MINPQPGLPTTPSTARQATQLQIGELHRTLTGAGMTTKKRKTQKDTKKGRNLKNLLNASIIEGFGNKFCFWLYNVGIVKQKFKLFNI